MRKTWQEKYDVRFEPFLKPLAKSFAGHPVGARMLIATPQEVEEYIKTVPAGETRTVRELRDGLAAKHGADVTCPTSTGIFLRIVSELALEQLESGATEESVAPFWRVVDPASPLAAKLPCGTEWIADQRRREAR